MNTYRVLVVDDSAFMRKMISDMINNSPLFEVVATARNGKDALVQVERHQPDVVTLDIEMPEMNGLEALKAIMSKSPLPVIMVSSLTKEGASETIQALEYGAVDFIRKPSGSISLDIHHVQDLLHEKLTMAVTNAVPKPIDQNQSKTQSNHVTKKTISAQTVQQFVAMGTSTGGPKALQQVIGKLPADFPAPILIVQHMPPQFTRSLAERLNSQSALYVVEAEDGMPIQAGVVYIAPGGKHMLVESPRAQQFRMSITRHPPQSGHRPSVDFLFQSLAKFSDIPVHLVVMTGMGVDGSKGMKVVQESKKRSGRENMLTTITESEQTCVVYGMPKAAAAQCDPVDYMVPLNEISEVLIKVVKIRK